MCSAAKLRLLAEYKGRKAALMVCLATLREEAADQLAELDSGVRPAGLDERFTAWVNPRG